MKLPITITQDGIQALIDAEQGRTNSVQIAKVGLSSTPFIAAPTIDVLPGEFKELTTIAGAPVGDNIIHMVATDADEASYTVTGIGIYLDSGVLFGVYSQGPADGALFQKSVASTFLFAVDITFQAGEAALINFGDTNFLYPPATETTKGVAMIATDADFATSPAAGDKIVTPLILEQNYLRILDKGIPNGVAPLDPTGKVPPAFLPALDSINTYSANSQAAMLALPATPGDFCLRSDLNETFILGQAPATTLANWLEFLSPGAPVRSVNGRIGDVVLAPADLGAVPSGRLISAQNLVRGGGSLAGDLIIDVEIASAAETLAGAINDKAVTPASLALLLAQLAAAVPGARSIGVGGLVQGGGDLSANRTITVPKATAADVEALADDTKAITPAALAGTLRSLAPNGYLRIPGSRLILQWGSGVMVTYFHGVGQPVQFKAFPIAFPSACFQTLFSITSNEDDGDEADEVPWIANWSNTGFNIADRGDWPTFSYSFLALGM